MAEFFNSELLGKIEFKPTEAAPIVEQAEQAAAKSAAAPVATPAAAAEAPVVNYVAPKTSEDTLLAVDIVEDEIDITVKDENAEEITEVSDNKTEEVDNPLKDEDFAMDKDDFNSALSENKDLRAVIDMVGKDDFYSVLDNDGDGVISHGEIKDFGFDIEHLDDNTMERFLTLLERNGLNVPSNEELEGIDLENKVFTDEVLEKLAELQNKEDEIKEESEENFFSDSAPDYSSSAPVSSTSGGNYGNYSSAPNAVNTNNVNNTAEIPDEEKNVSDLKNTVRPEKVGAVQDAKDKLAEIKNDEGALKEYKTNMENSYGDFSNALREESAKLANLHQAKRNEILAKEKMITEKEVQIAEKEALVSGLETTYNNLVLKRAGLIQNKKELEALDKSELDSNKKAKLEQTLKTIESEIASLDIEIASVQKKLNEEKENLQKMQSGEDGLSSLKEDLKLLEDDMDDIETEISALTSKNPELKGLYDLYNENKDAYHDKKTSLLTDAKAELKTAQAELNKLDELINTKEIDANNKQFSTKKFTEPDLFDSDMNISIQKVNDGKTMPYLLIGPENADPNEELPVLVYLHGLGQVGKSLDSLEQHQYDPAVIMKDWDLSNFNGYIICPLLPYGNWSNKNAENMVRNLYDNFKSTHAVDEDKVAVAGASLGAQGALYMANAMPDVFRKAAAFSPYNPGNLGNGMKIPTKAFVGSNDDGNSINFAKGVLKNYIGEDNYYMLNGQTHNSLPAAALMIDADGNGCSDILEWLFS